MKKIFKNETFWIIISQIVVLTLFAGYFNKNLDARFSKLKLQDEYFFNGKKEVYYEAIDIIDRNLADLEYDEVYKDHPELKTQKRNKGSIRPTELEINKCFHKLYLFAGDTTIPALFYDLMTKGADTSIKYIPVYDVRKFLNEVRKDMGNATEIDVTFKYLMSFVKDSVP